MIIIYYNPHKKIYYAKLLRNSYWNDEIKVGYVNQYDHVIVCMFYLTERNKLVNCESIDDYIRNKSTFKKRLIVKIIKFLERRV